MNWNENIMWKILLLFSSFFFVSKKNKKERKKSSKKVKIWKVQERKKVYNIDCVMMFSNGIVSYYYVFFRSVSCKNIKILYYNLLDKSLENLI